jgi:hypothetical protein
MLCRGLFEPCEAIAKALSAICCSCVDRGTFSRVSRVFLSLPCLYLQSFCWLLVIAAVPKVVASEDAVVEAKTGDCGVNPLCFVLTHCVCSCSHYRR